MREIESKRIKRLKAIDRTEKMLTKLFGDFKVAYKDCSDNLNLFNVSYESNQVQIGIMGYIAYGISGTRIAEVIIRKKKDYHFGRRIAVLLESGGWPAILIKDYLEYENPATARCNYPHDNRT